LKLEILYKDFPIEQGRQLFEELKGITRRPDDVTPVVKTRRKLRIPAGESK
jgi:hypothetical protein